MVHRAAARVRRMALAMDQFGLAAIASMQLRRIRKPVARSFSAAVRSRLAGARALEVGGPTTHLFGAGALLPVYPLLARVDNVNFAAGLTAWERVEQGETFVFDPDKAPGTQWVAEGTSLPMLATASYDAVLSSHAIEHTANPLKALREWRRILRPDGLLVVVAPDPTRTFDRRRPITTLEHLLEDEVADMPETDLTHVDEIVRLHDRRLDPGAPPEAADFLERCLHNAENRCLHHHVFDLALLRAAVERAGFRVVESERTLPMHLIVVAQPLP